MESALPRRWPRRQWILMTGLVILLHISVPMMFRDKAQPSRRPGTTLAVTDISGHSKRKPLGWDDPTLLAAPHSHDFSQQAWLRLKPREYQFSDWNEAPRWLAPETARLGQTGSSSPGANIIDLSALYTPLPDVPSPAPPETIPALETTLIADGGLNPADLLSIPSPGTITSTNLVTNSAVRVVVTSTGEVFSARLYSSSGNRNAGQIKADLHALELARDARFRPAPDTADASLRYGRLIFRWAVTQPPATNAPSAAPPPSS